MKHQQQVALLERILKHVEEGSTDVGEHHRLFDSAIYTSPNRLAAETEILFRKFPLVIGFSSQIPNPGDYFTHELSGVPLLAVRGKDGTARVFLNICRHRGAKICTKPSGSGCKVLVCPYHAWSYGLDGRLVGIPERKCFPQLNHRSTSLIALSTAERHGMLFAIPTPSPTLEMDIDAYLGPLGDELDGLCMASYVVGARKNLEGRIDWKLMIEANQESYHINFLHGKSAGRRYRKQCSLFDSFAPHSRSALVHATTGQVPLPADRAGWRILDYADLVYFLFPNTLVLWAGGGIQVISAFPAGLGKSVMQGARLVPAEAQSSREGRDLTSAFYANYWTTISEDVRVSETIQDGAITGLAPSLQLGTNEVLIQNFHSAVELALKGLLTCEGYLPPTARRERDGLARLTVE